MSKANWSRKKLAATGAVVALAFSTLAFAIYSYNYAMFTDRYRWPESARERIENMASTIRRLKSPARWCYPSGNPDNIYEFNAKESEQEFGHCLSCIAPVSGFQESDWASIKRFYRAEVGDKFCEVTLSTVFEDDRIVGSDCYFGFFPKDKDTGIGLTDDKSG